MNQAQVEDVESQPIIQQEMLDNGNGGRVHALPALSPESQSVRYNVVANGVAQTGASDTRGFLIVVIVQSVMLLAPSLAALIVTPLLGETCTSAPLGMWAFVYGLTMMLSLIISWIRYKEPAIFDGALVYYAECLRKPVDNFALVWLIMGQIWVQSAPECATSAPGLYTLCFWLVVIGFCYLLLPCILIILMLPFLCFCLPCVIRILARFTGADINSRTGATKDMIENIPKQKYHEGLFADESEPQCSICLCPYEDGQELRVLPCDNRHHFHVECIDEWLVVNATCPICRAHIVDGAEVEEEEEEDIEAQQHQQNAEYREVPTVV